jgi:hypothetical protein
MVRANNSEFSTNFQRSNAMCAFAATTILMLLISCTASSRREVTKANLCVTNMTTLWWELTYWNFNGDSFPPSLSSLSATSNPALFVCPGSGHTFGPMTNVEEWTDYVYLSGPHMDSSMLLDTAVLICPPENHDGKFGHVVWGGGNAIRLPAKQVRALIKEPWSMPTSARSSITIYGPVVGISYSVIPYSLYLRTNTTLHVPPRFRGIYSAWDYSGL